MIRVSVRRVWPVYATLAPVDLRVKSDMQYMTVSIPEKIDPRVCASEDGITAV